jgi:hypothetical protein
VRCGQFCRHPFFGAIAPRIGIFPRGIFFACPIVMIGKISSGPISEFENRIHPRAAAERPGGFGALLREKMAEPQPLERVALEFLRHALDLVLGEGREEERDPFLPRYSGSLGLSGSVPKSSPPEEPPVPQPGGYPSEYLPANQGFDPVIEEAGRRHGIDPALIRAVIQVESGGNPQAVSRAGAQGLMQLMPATAAEMGVENPFDPVQNIHAGTRYLRRLLDRYQGDRRLALAAYNWGMGNVEKRPEAMPGETRNFIRKVESRVQQS